MPVDGCGNWTNNRHLVQVILATCLLRLCRGRWTAIELIYGVDPSAEKPNKTLFAVRCQLLDRQDHCTAF